MPAGKGLLLSCIVTAMTMMVMHLSCAASKPVKTKTFLEEVKSVKLALWNLKRAGKIYVNTTFDLNGTLELIEGVVLFKENSTSEEIQTSSACVIIDCLKNTLPEIVRKFTPHKDRDGIINQVTVFVHQLSPIANCGQNQIKCVRTAGLHGFAMKGIGLRIFNTTTQWMESFEDNTL